MSTLSVLCFLASSAILIWIFIGINFKYFLIDIDKKTKNQKRLTPFCISPYMIHIMSQFVVCAVVWAFQSYIGRPVIDVGIKNNKIMLAIILAQLVMLPIAINIYSKVICKDKKICAFIYLTMLTMITFIDEISKNWGMFLVVSILITFTLRQYFKRDIETIVRNSRMENYDNMARVPIFAYIVVLSLAMLYNSVPVEDIGFNTSFSVLALTFCVFVFTTYKYAFGNYIKQVEILERTKEKKNMLEIQNKTQEEIILSLSEITEAKSGQTGKHVKRVSEYTRVLAGALNFSNEDIEKMRVASMMHDIGKLMIPSEILDKKGRLTNEEFDVIKTHAALGEEILHNTNGPIMDCAKIIALDHHEKWDGRGYNGKKGSEISIEGRIVAVADVYDALVSKRSYKDAWDEKAARQEIVVQSGKQFDPEVVDAFIKHYDEILGVWKKYKDIK